MTDSEMLRAIYDEVQELQIKVGTLESDMQFVKNEVRGIQLTLENETNKNIRIIAEGHIDLNRKLDAALKVEEEKEMDWLRLNVLENDMRRVKERVGIA